MDDALSAERDVPAKPGRLDPLLPGLASPIGWRWSTARTSSRSREHRPPDVHQAASTGRLVSPSIPIPRLCVDLPRAGGRSCILPVRSGTAAGASVDPVGLARFTVSLQRCCCRCGRAGSFHRNARWRVWVVWCCRVVLSGPSSRLSGSDSSMHRALSSRDHALRPCEVSEGRALVDRRFSLRRSSPAGRSGVPWFALAGSCLLERWAWQVLMFGGLNRPLLLVVLRDSVIER